MQSMASRGCIQFRLCASAALKRPGRTTCWLCFTYSSFPPLFASPATQSPLSRVSCPWSTICRGRAKRTFTCTQVSWNIMVFPNNNFSTISNFFSPSGRLAALFVCLVMLLVALLATFVAFDRVDLKRVTCRAIRHSTIPRPSVNKWAPLSLDLSDALFDFS